MKIKILRTTNEPEFRSEFLEYEIDKEDITLLQALEFIKTKIDNSLSFSSGCNSSICGSCALRVNDKEALACTYKVQDGDVITPLKNQEILRDLITDVQSPLEFIKKANASASIDATIAISKADSKLNELQSDCILCTSCFSACPVYEVNENFLGPFALSRAFRYAIDKRESKEIDILSSIQQNGIWDCTLCGDCYIACPQHINPKADIEKLRAKSSMNGFMDPNFANSFGGGLDFGAPTF
jgi:succinate dehydrogenase / fumarate reductase iron-sulfur subunit